VRQVDVILESEADSWFDRNYAGLGKVDPVTPMISEIGLTPKTMVEVGCANGWRLDRWHQLFGTDAIGVEPSRRAAAHRSAKGRAIRRGTADKLPIHSNYADVVIYGFCLYLADPEDWFRIAAEGDRVLASGGHLVVHDFTAGSHVEMRAYAHDERLLAYHFDFARLWLTHPRYSVVRRQISEEWMVTVLRKNGFRAEITP
jgi:SAM-dependent methyltransferase